MRIHPYPLSVTRIVLLRLRQIFIDLRLKYLRDVVKMDIGRDVKISLRADLDRTNPRGVHIGDGTCISFYAVVLSHDLSRHFHTHTYIGKNCFIGAHAIILPGITVGDECIVGAGAIVTKNVPPGSVVVGNPARIVRSGIHTTTYGILTEAYEEALAFEAVRSVRAAG
jgi:acetyltransferase-like isoleucine patch superfamily enzyme